MYEHCTDLKRVQYLANVDAGVHNAVGVPLAEIGDGGDGVEARVLRQRVGHDLERVGERAHAVLLEARKLRVVSAAVRRRLRAELSQTNSELRLPRAAASYQGTIHYMN